MTEGERGLQQEGWLLAGKARQGHQPGPASPLAAAPLHLTHLTALQVRAPMPPTYVFVIDVSFAAASCGMLGAVCATIKDTLDRLPGDERTQVAFITFDRWAGSTGTAQAVPMCSTRVPSLSS